MYRFLKTHIIRNQIIVVKHLPMFHVVKKMNSNKLYVDLIRFGEVAFLK